MRQLQARRKLAGRVAWAGIRAFAFLERYADEERVPRGQDGLGGHRITEARPIDARLGFGRLGHRRRVLGGGDRRDGLGEDGLRQRRSLGGGALLRDRGGALLGRRGLGVDGGGLGHEGGVIERCPQAIYGRIPRPTLNPSTRGPTPTKMAGEEDTSKARRKLVFLVHLKDHAHSLCNALLLS